MIVTNNVSKNFDNIEAVKSITVNINDGEVFGLIGTNGAGKSTFMRLISGILKPESGEILIDDIPVFENESAKKNFFYIADDAYFFSNSKPSDMANFYKIIYENFDFSKFLELLKKFDLPDRKISTYSKGMKKQLSIILAISSNTKYILCDETFDGLDPVIRQGVKSLFAAEIESRSLTPIIASHNLREIEDICEHIGLLHKGGMLISSDIDHLKLHIYKLQCIFEGEISDDFFNGLDIVIKNKRSSLYTLTIRGEISDIEQKIKSLKPIFYEILPLTLEEIFITETEAKGYELKNLID